MTLKLHLCTVVSVSNEGCHSFFYPDTIRKRVESRFLSMAHLICWLLTCDSDCCFWYVTNALCAWIKVDCILSSRRDSRQQPKSAAAARLAGVKVITLPREEVGIILLIICQFPWVATCNTDSDVLLKGGNSKIFCNTLPLTFYHIDELSSGEVERGRKCVETYGEGRWEGERRECG